MKRVNLFLLILTLASWIGTEALAYQCQWSPQLGAPLYRFGVIGIYSPWEGWNWAYKYYASNPPVFQKAGIVFSSVLVLLSVSLAQKKVPKVVARWAKRSDLRAAGLLSRHGVVLGKWGLWPFARLLHYDGEAHTLVVAPSGSLKSQSVAMPTTCTWKYSLFVHDPKAELEEASRVWRETFSVVYSLNPTSTATDHYNPFESVRIGQPDEIRDISLITGMMVNPDGEPSHGGAEEHFREIAIDVLNGLTIHGLYTGQAVNMAEFANFFMGDLGQIVQEMETTDHHACFPDMPDGVFDNRGTHNAVRWALSIIKRVGQKELGSICSTTSRALRLTLDQHVANMTSHSDFKIPDLWNGEKPVTLYLTIPYSDQLRLRLLSRMIVGQIIDARTQDLNTPKWRLLGLIDEVQALGRMPAIPEALNYVRGYGFNLCLITPSLNAIDRLYGDHNNFIESSHIQLAFAPNDPNVAERFSKRTGTLEVEKARESFSSDTLRLFGRRQTSISKENQRLYDQSEVMFMDKEEGLLLVGNGQFPARIRKAPIWKSRKLNRRKNMQRKGA